MGILKLIYPCLFWISNYIFIMEQPSVATFSVNNFEIVKFYPNVQPHIFPP